MTPHDKRYDEYRRKCAERDGWLMYGEAKLFSKGGILKYLNELPTYLDDASIDRVVRLLDKQQLSKYSEYLWEITGCQWSEEIHKATPEQKAEALFRTLIGKKGERG